MKVTLIQPTLGHKIGKVLNVSPSRAKYYMQSGVAAIDEEFLKDADPLLGCGASKKKPVTKKKK